MGIVLRWAAVRIVHVLLAWVLAFMLSIVMQFVGLYFVGFFAAASFAFIIYLELDYTAKYKLN